MQNLNSFALPFDFSHILETPSAQVQTPNGYVNGKRDNLRRSNDEFCRAYFNASSKKKEKDYQHLPNKKKRGLDCSSKKYVDFGVSSPALDLGCVGFPAACQCQLEDSRKLRSSGHKMPSLPLLLLLD